MFIKNYWFIVLIVLITGCEEVIDLDFPQKNPRIVVEALITDRYEPYIVRLSHTQKYTFRYDEDTTYAETGAIIILHESTGFSDTLDEISKGIYQSHPEIVKGTIGNSYRLEIITSDGKCYISETETMHAVSLINSIYYDRDPLDRDSYNPEYYRFNVYIDWQDPANERNYYLRKFSYYWSGIWHQNIRWNWVFNDKYFNGIYLLGDKITSDYGGSGFKIRVEQYSLTRPAYDFWIMVRKQTQEADELLINSTAPIIGNIVNANDPKDYALGYFQVSAMDIAEVRIN